MAKNSVWGPCGQYIYLFEKYGNEMGIPPIMLASFALQESTSVSPLLFVLTVKRFTDATS